MPNASSASTPARAAKPRACSFAAAAGLLLLTATLSACAGEGPPKVTIGLDKPSCITAGNPNACRLQRDLAGEFTGPNVRSR